MSSLAPQRAYTRGIEMNEDFQTSWSETSATVRHDEPSSTSRPLPNVPVKQIVTIRLDIDMLNWFKAAGPGYQTRINQILRDHMQAQRLEDAAN